MKRILNFLIGSILFVIFIQPDEVVSLPVRLLVFLIGFVLLALLDQVEQRRIRRENDAKPITSVKASVTGRRSMMVGSRKRRRMAYYLTFTTEDGSSLEYEVSELEFGRLGMGESGTLEYRGWQYLGLRRYDLGKMEPVAEPEEERCTNDAEHNGEAVRRVNGVLAHELEE